MKQTNNKMRAITIATLLCVFATAFGQHDLYLGQVTYGDIVLYRVNEYKYGFPFFVRESTIEYPIQGQVNNAVIRAIFIKDNYSDGNGGYPTLKSGGVGQRFVKIKLKSQRGSGFNFTITIYGRYM